jgi:two-component system OmpR family sensor kinase
LRARELAGNSRGPGIARFAQAADGHTWLLFLPEDGRSMRPPLPEHGPPVPWVPIIGGIIGSLAASALLAWYLARPIRVLREAFESTAAGKLDTRVQQRMGSRRDEIADLGRDFDRMATRIESLVISQRRLLHDVSHELRSPLARLQVAIGLARQDPQKLQITLDRVERESTRLDDLVGELLTLSRLEASASDQIRGRLDLAELLVTISDDARFEAQASGRDLRCVAPAAFMMDGHEESLHRALENVIRNALKYTPEGGTVDVELKAIGAGAEVTVCDRGPGVPDDDLDRIFEPFYRGSQPRLPGAGLGLAIAQRAVRSHGGNIRASNRSDGGLCVEIRLPAM